MKKGLFILLFLYGISYTASCQLKYTLLDEIYSYKKEVVRGASYSVDYKCIFDSVKCFLSSDYALTSIASNGLMKGEAKGKIRFSKDRNFETMYFIESEISPSKPFVVQFKQWEERRSTKRSTGEVTPWKRVDKEPYETQIAFYEKMNGTIKLPKTLQTKIDDYNERQPTEQLKIVEGKDY